MCGEIGVIEGDTRANDINKGESLMSKASLNKRDKLLFIPENDLATKLAPSSIARLAISILSYKDSSPAFVVDPRSAVAESWPLVSPYVPLLATI